MPSRASTSSSTKGETLGIVGESGCGKSTLARMLVGLDRPIVRIDPHRGHRARDVRPRRHAAARPHDPVCLPGPGLVAQSAQDHPHHPRNADDPPARPRQGGARGAARRTDGCGQAVRPISSTATRTSFPAARRSGSASPGRSPPNRNSIILDEPVSALDVSVQAQVLNLLDDLQAALRPDLRLHQPRPVGGRERLRPGGGDVFRPDRRARRGARAVPAAAPSLHQAAFRRGAGARQAERSRRGRAGGAARPLRAAARAAPSRRAARTPRTAAGPSGRTLSADRPSPTQSAACFFPVGA